jgi:S1-C subfamily serine protease
MPYNTRTKNAYEATGWFITSNRIVTNSHVISVTFDKMDIINVATGQKYTVDHVAYNNAATDIAVLVVNESNNTSALYHLIPKRV